MNLTKSVTYLTDIKRSKSSFTTEENNFKSVYKSLSDKNQDLINSMVANLKAGVAPATKAHHESKQNLPAVLWSAVCVGGVSNEHAKCHTGYIAIDVDHNDKTKPVDLRNTANLARLVTSHFKPYALHVTASGSLRFVLLVPELRNAEITQEVEQQHIATFTYYAKCTAALIKANGLDNLFHADEQTKAISQKSFVFLPLSFPADTKGHPIATADMLAAFEPAREPKQAASSQLIYNATATSKPFMLEHLPVEQQVSIALELCDPGAPYEQWFSVINTLATLDGNKGSRPKGVFYRMAEDWSRQAGELFKQNDISSRWNGIDNTKDHFGILAAAGGIPRVQDHARSRGLLFERPSKGCVYDEKGLEVPMIKDETPAIPDITALAGFMPDCLVDTISTLPDDYQRGVATIGLLSVVSSLPRFTFVKSNSQTSPDCPALMVAAVAESAGGKSALSTCITPFAKVKSLTVKSWTYQRAVAKAESLRSAGKRIPADIANIIDSPEDHDETFMMDVLGSTHTSSYLALLALNGYGFSYNTEAAQSANWTSGAEYKSEVMSIHLKAAENEPLQYRSGNSGKIEVPGRFAAAYAMTTDLALKMFFGGKASKDGLNSRFLILMKPYVPFKRMKKPTDFDSIGKGKDPMKRFEWTVQIEAFYNDLAAMCATEYHLPVLPHIELRKAIEARPEWEQLEELIVTHTPEDVHENMLMRDFTRVYRVIIALLAMREATLAIKNGNFKANVTSRIIDAFKSGVVDATMLSAIEFAVKLVYRCSHDGWSMLACQKRPEVTVRPVSLGSVKQMAKAAYDYLLTKKGKEAIEPKDIKDQVHRMAGHSIESKTASKYLAQFRK